MSGTTGYILPGQSTLTVLIGADFTSEIIVYQDNTQTVPFDLTGFTIVLSIAGFIDLTPGSGLTVDYANGKIDLALSHAQTTAATTGSKHFTLKLTDSTGFISFPLAGSVLFVSP